MNAEERDEIMFSAAQVNNSIDEPMNQILVQEEQQRPPDAANTTNVLRTGSFLGVGDGIHNAEGTAKVIPLQDGSSILRLKNPDLYVYLSPDKSAQDIVNIGN